MGAGPPGAQQLGKRGHAVIGGEGDNQVVSPHLLHQKREESLQQPVGTDGDIHHLMAVRPVAVAHQIVGGEADCQQVGVRVSTQVLGPYRAAYGSFPA